MARDVLPLANGTSTDHPYPGLPFVDDSHIPVNDLQAVSKIGRNVGDGMWGRYDAGKNDSEFGYTTDPYNHNYGWIVQYHPEHGRVVLLYHDDDTGFVHSDFLHSGFLITRRGGYCWDGAAWYRPLQILDWSTETLVFRKVSKATTLTAADLLDDACRPNEGEHLKITAFEPSSVPKKQWRHDLSLWAEKRREPDAPPFSQCIVSLSAPELAEKQLIGVQQVASLAGITEQELRREIHRERGDTPLPQSEGTGDLVWSKPVVHDWIEARKRDGNELARILHPTGGTMPLSQVEMQAKVANTFEKDLIEHDTRRRGLFRKPSAEERRDLAGDMAWLAVHEASASIPLDEMLWTVEHSALWDMRDYSAGERISLTRMTGVMLGWMVKNYPRSASRLFGSIIREASDEFGFSKQEVILALRSSVVMDGGFEDEQRDALKRFLDLAMPPSRDK